MANPEHEAILRQGVEVWNKWRKDNPDVRPDLSGVEFREADFKEVDFSNVTLEGADLKKADLRKATLEKAYLKGVDFSQANLEEANLKEAILKRTYLARANLNKAMLTNGYLDGASFDRATLIEANFNKATLKMTNLTQANLENASLIEANLNRADLSQANFFRANLVGASLIGAMLKVTNLGQANLKGADLSNSIFIETNLEHADISGCNIYGISTWGLNVNGLIQSNLIISKDNEPEITVDNLEIAQFMYLLLNNAKLRSVIDTLTTKSVLILGRFTPERKTVLDGIREKLRQHDYVPMLFDFENSDNRDLTETIKTLAGLARFVIADLSDPNSIPHELMSFAEGLLSVPVQGIFCPTDEHPMPYPMYEHLRRYPHVLPIYRYETADGLMAALEEHVIKPAEEKVEAMRPPK